MSDLSKQPQALARGTIAAYLHAQWSHTSVDAYLESLNVKSMSTFQDALGQHIVNCIAYSTILPGLLFEYNTLDDFKSSTVTTYKVIDRKRAI